MDLNFTGKQDVYLEVARKYREYISLGVYKSGEKLPSVREAAGELGVNPNTVAKAYTLLEEEGYIITLPKKGAFVHPEPNKEEAPNRKDVIRSLKQMGFSKQTLLTWIEEVYGND